jgi:3-hydroxy-9,10-secoandrosta-1,3,5(10)-triene-9,17-dione monooxygenase reductase component
MSAPGTPIDPHRYRAVLGSLPTGVIVITAAAAEGPVGMACNSFTSASLEPPLVALFAAKSSSTWPAIRDAGRFCVNVMAAHHEDVVRRFAARGVDRFAGVEHQPSRSGPALTDAVAWIHCRLDAEHDAGDHTVVLAEVLELDARDEATALVFWRGAYGPASLPPSES